LGKAVYENQLVELPLAPFFISKLLGKSNSLADLASLDAELHRNLLYILRYRGDFGALGLNWSVTELNPETGVMVERDLVRNGRNIPVTRENHIHYVYAMANCKRLQFVLTNIFPVVSFFSHTHTQLLTTDKMNVSIKRQCKAFGAGFAHFVRPFAARLFNEQELQMLISGEEGPLDIAQWQRSCQYSGGYHPSQPIIREFWEVVESFTAQQQRGLLRFITSCSRPPLQGFDALYPQICIHKRDGGDEYLPTAATCMNLLKLPVYSNKYIMRERLLYAIESDSGFNLS
jgi:ubiquitin-protein ligase E3 C